MDKVITNKGKCLTYFFISETIYATNEEALERSEEVGDICPDRETGWRSLQWVFEEVENVDDTEQWQQNQSGTDRFPREQIK